MTGCRALDPVVWDCNAGALCKNAAEAFSSTEAPWLQHYLLAITRRMLALLCACVTSNVATLPHVTVRQRRKKTSLM